MIIKEMILESIYESIVLLKKLILIHIIIILFKIYIILHYDRNLTIIRI